MVIVLGLGLAACELEDTDMARSKAGIPTSGTDGGAETGADGSPDDGETVDPATLACQSAPTARTYLNFDGTHLEAGRINEGLGVNRVRQKPFDVLAGEYQRVLGVVPEGLDTGGASFDVAPDRWFNEPALSAVSLNALFDLSFDACLKYTKASAEFSTLPTEETATTTCTSLARKAWSRTPSPEETSACVDLALHGADAESDPSRRWAYVCASVLGSAGFLTY